MGKVHELVSKHIVNGASIASVSACDHLVVGGVSNWGGWALALCLFKGGGGLSATGEFRILNALVDAGARDGVTSGAFLPLSSLLGPVSCSQSLKHASIFPDWSFLPCMCVHECKTSRVCTDGRWAGMVTSRGASATHVAFVKARTVVSNSHGRALSGTPPQRKGSRPPRACRQQTPDLCIMMQSLQVSKGLRVQCRRLLACCPQPQHTGSCEEYTLLDEYTLSDEPPASSPTSPTSSISSWPVL